MVRCFVTLYFFVYRMHAHEKCVLFIIYEDLQVNMSNTTRFSKIRSFFGFKFTRQEMEAIQTRISEANHRGLLIAVRISTLYFVILFVLSLFVHAIFPFRKLYAVTGILDLVLYFLVRRTRREDGRRNLFLVYIFYTLILVFSVLLGTYNRREELAVAYDMLITALPMLFIDRPGRLSAFLAGFTSFFCVMAFVFDNSEIVVHDIGNAVIITTISMMVNIYMIRTKVQELVYEEALFQQSEWDTLTGVRNRDSYEKRLKELPEKICRNLVIVYADGNGLHELNNMRGHNAGDHMLQAVSSTLQGTFGRDATYRIGGDEFVVLLPDAEEGEVLQKLSWAQKTLGEQGYEISAGEASGEKEGLDVASLIRMAEQAMYQQKREFYCREEHDRRRQ